MRPTSPNANIVYTICYIFSLFLRCGHLAFKCSTGVDEGTFFNMNDYTCILYLIPLLLNLSSFVLVCYTLYILSTCTSLTYFVNQRFKFS